MKDKLIKSKDLLEIEDILPSPEALFYEQINRYGFVSRDMLLRNCNLTPGVVNNMVRQCLDKDIIKGVSKLIKFKGKLQYNRIRGYAKSKNYPK